MAEYSRGKSLLSQLDFIHEQGYSKTLSCCRVMRIVKEYSHARRIGENGIGDLSLCYTMQESYNTSYTKELEHYSEAPDKCWLLFHFTTVASTATNKL